MDELLFLSLLRDFDSLFGVLVKFAKELTLENDIGLRGLTNWLIAFFGFLCLRFSFESDIDWGGMYCVYSDGIVFSPWLSGTTKFFLILCSSSRIYYGSLF